MRKLIVSDLHGRDPSHLLNNVYGKNNIDQFICLGDIESPELTEKLLTLDFPKIILMGNHDYPYLDHCRKILRGEKVCRATKPDFLSCSLEEYWQDVDKWLKSPILSKYALELKSLKHEEETRNGNLAYVHASLFEDDDIFLQLGVVLDEGRPYQLWPRMHDVAGNKAKPIITGNFSVMTDPYYDYWLMFRGHDFGQRIYSLNKDSNLLGNFSTTPKLLDKPSEYTLTNDSTHIICIGNYQIGQYVLFNDDTRLLEFHDALA